MGTIEAMKPHLSMSALVPINSSQFTPMLMPSFTVIATGDVSHTRLLLLSPNSPDNRALLVNVAMSNYRVYIGSRTGGKPKTLYTLPESERASGEGSNFTLVPATPKGLIHLFKSMTEKNARSIYKQAVAGTSCPVLRGLSGWSHDTFGNNGPEVSRCQLTTAISGRWVKTAQFI